jgi:hypothetical protein
VLVGDSEPKYGGGLAFEKEILPNDRFIDDFGRGLFLAVGGRPRGRDEGQPQGNRQAAFETFQLTSEVPFH